MLTCAIVRYCVMHMHNGKSQVNISTAMTDCTIRESAYKGAFTSFISFCHLKFQYTSMPLTVIALCDLDKTIIKVLI